MSSTTSTVKREGHAAHTQAAEGTLALPGKFDRPIKVTMLGAGSHFTHPLMNDILAIEGAEHGEIALVDIDAKRLAPMAKIITKLAEAYGKSNWTVTATTDRAEALPGSQYVINSIEVAGVDCVRFDNDIPLKYGIDQCIGDTIGPGGIMKALRTGPVWLDILRDVVRYCPEAIVLNYTNPMSMLCLAGARAVPALRDRTIGLCHSVQLTSKKLARDAGVPLNELEWRCAGINHLAWFTTLKHQGEDLYPRLRALVEGRTGDVYESDPVRYDMMLHFGAFITESSGHLSEYLPYYRKHPEALKVHCRDGYRGGSSFYADNWPTWRDNHDENRNAILRGEKPLTRQRTHEYAAWIIEAREKHSPVSVHGNVMNHDGTGRGELISNLPADACVEVACMIDRNGINPTRHGPLPAQMAGVCQSNMSVYDLAATAVVEKSKEAAIHAMLLDPLSAAVCTPSEIRKMAGELFDAEARFLPGFG
ncbi:MAG: alpha-glucosidase/alpha-galactosidase [Phycisphaeraceae bacterium]